MMTARLRSRPWLYSPPARSTSQLHLLHLDALPRSILQSSRTGARLPGRTALLVGGAFIWQQTLGLHAEAGILQGHLDIFKGPCGFSFCSQLDLVSSKYPGYWWPFMWARKGLFFFFFLRSGIKLFSRAKFSLLEGGVWTEMLHRYQHKAKVHRQTK